ncbi:MAG: hypothetical protein AAFZ07_03420 [Actinomycetota bacterium]
MIEWEPISGNVVFDSSTQPVGEQERHGLSMLGQRTVRITDGPAVAVHDTGGFGTAAVHTLDPAPAGAIELELLPGTSKLRVRVSLDEGRSLALATREGLTGDGIEALRTVTSAMLGGQRPDDCTPVALPFSVRWEDADDLAPLDETPTAVLTRRGGRLALERNGTTVLDWPRRAVRVAGQGDGVEIRGGAVLDGRMVSAVVVETPSPELRDLVLALPLPDDAGDEAERSPATAAAVEVVGLEVPDGEPVEAVLGERVLDLQMRSTQTPLVAFELDDRNLRVAGSTERFVAFHPATGPVVIAGKEEAFGRKLLAHPALEAAAVRTLEQGPYPVEREGGRPAIAAATPTALRVRGPGLDARLRYDDLTEVAPEIDGPSTELHVVAGVDDLRLTSRTELVQRLHTSVRAAATAEAAIERVTDLLRAALGLEDDLLLTSIVGPIYDLHAVLLGGADRGTDLGRAVSLPETEAERERLTIAVNAGLVELRRHLDHVAHVFAPFLRSRDARVIAPAVRGEPEWLKASESRLRLALSPVQRLAGEVAQLLGVAGRLPGGEAARLGSANYGGAAVSLGAAALINPIFLVGGVTQAVSQRMSERSRRSQLDDATTRTWRQLLEGWTLLVDELVPTITYTITENVFPVRHEVARQIGRTIDAASGEARVAAAGRVAERLAVLDISRRYPATPAVGVTRGEVADHIRGARDRVRVPRFVEF